MKASENYRNQENAKPALPPDALRPPVDETLQHVLLQQPPAKAQNQLPGDGPIGMPSQKIYSPSKPPTHEQPQGRRQEHGQQQELSRGHEVVETKTQVAQGLASQAVRANHENESQRNRDCHGEFASSHYRR
jgi:hypothetical protein